MSLLRAVARTMLASYFVVNGVKAFRHPDEFSPAAQPLADRFLPVINSALPPQAAAYVPTDATGLVRASGALQVIGGLSLASGLGRRVGAGVLAATMLPHVLATAPRRAQGSERVVRQSLLTKNVALMGGVLLASQDTEGKPTLAWRARAKKQLLEREAARAKVIKAKEAKQVAQQAKKAGRRARKRHEGEQS